MNVIHNIDMAMQQLEYIMETDPRTFQNRNCKNEEVFDEIYQAYKHLQEARFKYYKGNKKNG